MITSTRLRRRVAVSVHRAVRIIRDAIAVTRRAAATGKILARMDSGCYSPDVAAASIRAGAWFSIGAKQDPEVRRATAAIPEDAWVAIKCPNAILDPDTGELISEAQVAETTCTTFTSHPRSEQITAR